MKSLLNWLLNDYGWERPKKVLLMPLTLEDIARMCGVSRSTVSRVMNGDTYVKTATREKVMAVIREYNFQPNLAARSLAAGRTNVLGLVIPAGVSTLFTDPYFPQLIQGVSSACNAQDYSVMLWLAEPEFERKMINQILHNGLADGVIVSSMLIDDPIVHSLHQSKMPFILVGRHPVLDVNYIDVDNLQGSMEATRYLLLQGHKRVATITGPKNMIGGFDRFQGYCNALKMNKISYQTELVGEGDFSEAGGYSCMLKLLKAKPDAVFAASDMMAYGAIRAIREAGLRVPEDIAVVGFDDLPTAAHHNPPLTTIRQPIQTMGFKAVETLLDIIQNPTCQTQHILLPTELIVRSSTGINHAGIE
jgi:LacI family transcriptional regulator